MYLPQNVMIVHSRGPAYLPRSHRIPNPILHGIAHRITHSDSLHRLIRAGCAALDGPRASYSGRSRCLGHTPPWAADPRAADALIDDGLDAGVRRAVPCRAVPIQIEYVFGCTVFSSVVAIGHWATATVPFPQCSTGSAQPSESLKGSIAIC